MEPTVIDSVTLRVNDLDGSTTFYQDVLGLVGRDESGGVREFRVPEHDSPIVRLVESPDARPKPARALGLYHFALLVPDRPALASVLRQLADRNVRLQGASDHHVSEALYLADPDGHGIEIYRDRPKEEWTSTPQGELYMTTAPLDVQELASAATRAFGLPAGTIIGHVHLHVSDLRTSEAFYVDGLGFDVTVRSYPGALFLSKGGYHHHVGLNTWAGPNAERPDDRTVGLVEFGLHVEKRNEEASDEVVPDPDGIRIRLVS